MIIILLKYIKILINVIFKNFNILNKMNKKEIFINSKGTQFTVLGQ